MSDTTTMPPRFGKAKEVPRRLDVQDNTVDRGVKPKFTPSFGTSFHDFARDYTDGNPFVTTLGGTLDAALAAGSVYPQTRPIALPIENAASAYYNAPILMPLSMGKPQDTDYWKRTGKEHREMVKKAFTPMTKEEYNDEVNRLRADFRKALTPKIPFVNL
jgi:hypothetical protein